MAWNAMREASDRDDRRDRRREEEALEEAHKDLCNRVQRYGVIGKQLASLPDNFWECSDEQKTLRD